MAQGQYKNKAYPLRIKEETLTTVKDIAEQNNISANKQIEMILENYIRAYDARPKTAKAEVAINIANLAKIPRSKISKIQKRP